jgi:hypothetical protein
MSPSGSRRDGEEFVAVGRLPDFRRVVPPPFRQPLPVRRPGHGLDPAPIGEPSKLKMLATESELATALVYFPEKILGIIFERRVGGGIAVGSTADVSVKRGPPG